MSTTPDVGNCFARVIEQRVLGASTHDADIEVTTITAIGGKFVVIYQLLSHRMVDGEFVRTTRVGVFDAQTIALESDMLVSVLPD